MPREIGWSQESNLLYQIIRLLKGGAAGGGSSVPAVESYATYSAFPAAGVVGTFYVDASTGNQYVWDGTKYVYVQSKNSINPPFPYPPTITFNTGPDSRIPGNSGSIVGIDRTFSSIYTFPIIGKQYPDPSLNLVVYNSLPGANVVYAGQTSMSINNIEATSATAWTAIPATITSITVRDLKYWMTSSSITPSFTSGITSVSFPELIFLAPTFVLTTASLTSLSFPKLEVIGGSSFTNNITGITTWNFPELLEISSQFSDSSTAVTSYSFPKLRVLGTLFLFGTKSSLTSITLPAIEYISSGISMPTTSAALTTFTFGPNLKAYGQTTGNFVTTSNSLNQASVDNILIRLAALDGTGGTIPFSNRTVTITGGAATPSAAGLAAKAILVARGCTVTNN